MKEQIHAAIEKALRNSGIEETFFAVDHPTDKNTEADYFSNVAMVVFSKPIKESREFVEDIKKEKIDRDYHRKIFSLRLGGEFRSSPREVAEYLRGVLIGNISGVEKIEVAGPGFLNFTLRRD